MRSFRDFQPQHWITLSLFLGALTASGSTILINPDTATRIGLVEVGLSLIAGLCVMITVQLYGRAWQTIREQAVGGQFD